MTVWTLKQGKTQSNTRYENEELQYKSTWDLPITS